MDGHQLVNLRLDLTSAQVVTQILCLTSCPVAVLLIQTQASIVYLAKDLLQMTEVIVPRVAVNDHVIKICSTAVLTTLKDTVC